METVDLYKASAGLRSVVTTMGTHHVPREIVKTLYDWVTNPKEVSDKQKKLCVLKGKAGCGKTVVMHDLQEKLNDNSIAVLGLKSDLLFGERESKIDDAVGMPILDSLREKANRGRVVLLVDQVDALSLMLSSNRSPLMAVNGLIKDALNIDNIRIVVSCRPYDFDYDSVFHWMKMGEMRECTRLEKSEVQDTFLQNGLEFGMMDDEMLDFLRTPLYLSLYCHLSSKNREKKMVSITKLYEKWIDQVVIEEVEKTENLGTSDLMGCLEAVVSRMITYQELSIPESAIITALKKAKDFLVENEVLRTNDGLIQFPHQTLLDYIYARLFFENGHTLEQDFRDVHQGLFVRPRLKYVLDYLHATDTKRYVSCLTQLLTQQKDSGYTYHYHLRHLTISALASYDSLSKEERDFIVAFIYPDEERYHVYSRYAHGAIHLRLMHDYIMLCGGLGQCGEEQMLRYVNMMNNMSWNQEAVNEVTNAVLEMNPEKISPRVKQELMRQFNYLHQDAFALDKVSSFVEKLDIDPLGLPEFDEYYRRLISANPEKTRRRIEQYIAALLHQENENYSNPEASDSIGRLSDELREKCTDEYLKLGLNVLLLYKNKTFYPDDDIKEERELMHFNRSNEYHSHYSDMLLCNLMDEVEAKVETGDEGIDAYLLKLSQTDSASCHTIAIAGWMKNIKKYRDVVYCYLNDNLNRTQHSSVLGYYHVELFGEVFDQLDDEQQNVLMSKVSMIDPEWEHRSLPAIFNNRNMPLTRVGYTRGQFYEKIPHTLLKERFAESYKEWQELRRKYMSLENYAPNKVTMHEGWTTMSPKSYPNMTDEQILDSMARIKDNLEMDWNTPTLTGHSGVLSHQAEEAPERYYNIYMMALDRDDVSAEYMVDGFRSLFSHVDEEKSTALLEKLLLRIGEDINQIDSSLLIGVIRLLDNYTKQDLYVPEKLFRFVEKVAEQYDETRDVQYDIEHHQGIDINVAINRVRGAAVSHLIECFYVKDYQERIIEVYERIADSASPTTRCAMLFQMALFVRKDRERTLNLFLRITADYNEGLLCLPAHRLNPLYYITGVGFEKLKPYYAHCLESKEASSIAVHFLSAVWARGNEQAGEICLQMADKYETAAVQLVDDAWSYSKSGVAMAGEVLNRYLALTSSAVGMAYDRGFRNARGVEDVLDEAFLNAFFQSRVCAYAQHHVYAFLRTMAEVSPTQCLKWLMDFFRMKRDEEQLGYKTQEIVTTLLCAYKHIQRYPSEDALLDDAMNLLDEILASTEIFMLEQQLETWEA